MLSQVPSRLSVLNDNKNKKFTSILDRPLNKSQKSEVNLSAFAFMFSEMVQYSQKNASGIPDLEKKLGEIGYRVGYRMSELIFWRDKGMKRETKYLQMLIFIHTNVWKSLFGKQADALERSTDNEDEYMIHDNDPLLNKFISVPKDFSQLNCCAFLSGILEAILEGAQFNAKVSAHSNPMPQFPQRTTMLIKFDSKVMEREKA